ncbi:pyridoxamine 5-phosphate oxidase [Limnobaculum zhutongyuii]|uniref:Pyridoxamine 5-phosphate oxidase n=1 Tax=Limnobaculum zhutongyuii TaxID=2498113 RepID=A0A411WLR1_9GAMM|nr:MSMEG_1061 family FMN-dependent PPOX-type flavoprotein [Limnobaculum zhutongyuii]QBH97086.1 pyridoxamine 5-phosphate oxidase [Limnobaculum zhutongyuii]TQS88345.1 pyridoxamine 5-phosphate oxidase [Limnobaculum zhutongyuii]
MYIKPEHVVSSQQQLREYYEMPHEIVVKKQIDFLAPYGQKLIAMSPFFVLATVGKNGVDASPKGGYPGFVKTVGEKTLLIPDYAGNNRLDGLQNIIENPQVGLTFLVPGYNETFRVNGKATISIDPSLCEFFTDTGKKVKCVIVVNIEEAFIHCGQAISLAKLWDSESQTNKDKAPTLDEIIQFHTGRETVK